MNKLNLLLVALVVMLASCSIEMNMTVNEDYSGHQEMIIDISSMMSFAASMDSLSEEDMDSIMAEISPEDEITDEEREILAESGITNLEFNMDMDMENMKISYDFTDINRSYDFFYVLDSSVTDEERIRMQELEMFKIEDDRITIKFEDDGITKMLEEEMASEGGDDDMDMSFMTMLFTFKQSYTFARPVADIKDNGLPVRLDGNRVHYNTNLSEYLKDFTGKEIVVIFEDGKKKKKK